MCPYLSRCIFTVQSLKLNMGLLQYYLSGKLNEMTLIASWRQFSVCSTRIFHTVLPYFKFMPLVTLNAGSN